MSTGATFAALGRRTLGLADMLLDGIPDDQFARLAVCEGNPVQTNHPAFVFGHLAIYGSRICELAGDTRSAERVATPEPWSKLFGFGCECRDDADGSLYPPRAEIITAWKAGFEAAIASTEAADDARFNLENPIERMRKIAPTVGVGVGFMLGSHPMYHLGQVSAWRRMIGLGSAMKM